MVKVPWKAAQDGVFEDEGAYAFEIVSSTEKTSRSGDPMFDVKLKAIEYGRMLCYDTLMMGGKGAGIGVAKLKALGFDPRQEEVSAGELIGKRGFAFVVKDEYEGKVKMKVDIHAEGSSCGYWPESSPPEGVISPSDQEALDVVDEDSPF